MEQLVNKERLRAGVPPLALDKDLCDLAGMKAHDMRDNAYFGHYSDTLGSMTELVDRVIGETPRVGENIALNFPSDEAVHGAWMCSALHRKNILDSCYDRFGYAWAEVGEAGRVYVQVFAGNR